ncbi:MAG: 30S ribosomal protein S20 [Bacillota bacterium]
MPNIKSAKKRVEVIKKRTLKNAPIKSAVKTSVRKFEEALTAAPEQAKTTLTKAVEAIDKAVTKGVLHKNTAARKKSRLAKKLNKTVS